MTDRISESQELHLLMNVRNGDTELAQELLAPYRPLLASLAMRLTRGSWALTTEELIQAGYVGMLRAARRFDPAQAVRFATYAVPWALGEMKRAMRQALNSTGAYDKRKQIAKQEETLFAQLGRSPSAQELAKACGMNDWELVSALSAASPLSLDSGDTGFGADGTELEERLDGGEIDMEAVNVRFAMEKLDQESRRLILLRYFRDQTQKETARLLGKSQTQVCRLERRALDTLKALLKEE